MKVEVYKELYFFLFAQIADALEELEQGNIGLAKNRLSTAQKEAEDRFLNATSES